MIRNTVEQYEIKKEQKLARQFVIAAIMVVLIVCNTGYFMIHGYQECGIEIPSPYIVQACFIPVLLAFMVYYFFRLHRKNIAQLREKEEAVND